MKYSYKKIISKCPICSNKNNLLLYEINSEDATRYLISKKEPKKFETLKSLIEKLWKKDSCKKILCKKCSLIFADPFVSGNEEFYSQIYSSPEKYPSWRWDYKATLDFLKEYSKDKKTCSLLEIGAGIGEFLKRIPENTIPKKNLYSCEISDTGKKELEKKGIKNYNDLKEIKQKFDIICTFETIEHLDILDKLFIIITKIISENGHLFISTPAQKTIKFFEQNGSGLDLPPTHISCWNKESFEIVAKKYGFKIVERKLNKLKFFKKMLNFGLGTFETKKLKKGSIEDRIDNIHKKKIRKIYILLYLIIKSPYFFLKVLTKKLYASQWIHLQKKD